MAKTINRKWQLKRTLQMLEKKQQNSLRQIEKVAEMKVLVERELKKEG